MRGVTRAESGVTIRRRGPDGRPAGPRGRSSGRLFTGLELLEPGVVPVDRWRPDASVAEGPDDMGFRGGLGLEHGTA
ncbi:SAM-dependent methyltransferase [Streptomyces sp. NPDC001665]